jgi:hypothetical protein
MNETSPIDVDVDVRFGELLRTNLIVHPWTILLLCFYIALGILLLFGNQSAIFGGIVFICLGLGFFLDTAIHTHRNFKQSLKVAPVKHFRLSDEAIEASSIAGSGKISWTSFRKVRETGIGFILYAAPKKAILIPKRCLGDETQIQALRNLVSAQCGEKAKLR